MKPGFYWVRTTTYYETTGERVVHPIPTIGRCEIVEGRECWDIIASDEGYNTYNEKRKMEHRETCIIPIKRITEV